MLDKNLNNPTFNFNAHLIETKTTNQQIKLKFRRKKISLIEKLAHKNIYINK